MRFVSFEAWGFRYFAHARAHFSPQANILLGNNGQGKTSVLEALYVLAGFRSFRGAKNRDMIQHGRAEASLHAEIEAEGVMRAVELTLRPGAKRFLIDGKAPGSLSMWMTQMVVVTFSPDDLYLVKGEPERRRRWLDRLIFLLEPAHLHNVSNYQRALKARNALLKDGLFGRDQMLLDTYDETLAKSGWAVAAARRSWAARLSEVVAEEVSRLTGGAHRGHLGYESDVDADDWQALLARLVAKRNDDIKRKITTAGVHYDDLALFFAERDARRFASQGEQRALTLALKLAETQLLREERKVAPALLLDDVAGELDAERNAFLFRQLERENGQIFIAGTHLEDDLRKAFARGRIFTLVNGEISEIN